MSEEEKPTRKRSTKKSAVKPKAESKKSKKSEEVEEKKPESKPKKKTKTTGKAKAEPESEAEGEAESTEEPKIRPSPTLSIRSNVKGLFRSLPKIRQGKGFSVSEIKEAGLTIDLATRMRLFVDRRRRSSHKENVEMLKTALKDAGIVKP
ncbi:MAG: ribosomal protein L13e [Nitrososphaerota archaeon]|nr:ribosomal protein L13e [Nitrososphaerota archaeon]